MKKKEENIQIFCNATTTCEKITEKQSSFYQMFVNRNHKQNKTKNKIKNEIQQK